jgi:hypothetical protein
MSVPAASIPSPSGGTAPAGDAGGVSIPAPSATAGVDVAVAVFVVSGMDVSTIASTGSTPSASLSVTSSEV